jgi:hypothetical protein
MAAVVQRLVGVRFADVPPSRVAWLDASTAACVVGPPPLAPPDDTQKRQRRCMHPRVFFSIFGPNNYRGA